MNDVVLWAGPRNHLVHYKLRRGENETGLEDLRGLPGAIRAAAWCAPPSSSGWPSGYRASSWTTCSTLSSSAMIAKRRLLMAKAPGEGHILPGALLRPR